MKINFKIPVFSKNQIIIVLVSSFVILLVLLSIIILLLVFSCSGVKNSIASKTQIEPFQKRIAQLEDTVKQLTGSVPPEGLRSVSGVVLSQERLGKDSMLLRMYVHDIDVKAESIDPALLFPDKEEALLEVVANQQTKISFLMAPSEGTQEPLSYEQFERESMPPYAVLVQTTSENPVQQKRIQAFSITRFFSLEVPASFKK